MPPKLRALKHRTKLSWHAVPRRLCTIDRQESKEYFRRQLEVFRQHVRDHYIEEFGAGHRVLAKGKFSRQFYRTSLRSLLELDTIPDQIKIPCWHLPHKCAYCNAHPHRDNLWISLFIHISAVPRPRGRPSRNSDHSKTVTVLYPSDSSDSENSDDIDFSDSNSSDDIYDIDTGEQFLNKRFRDQYKRGGSCWLRMRL